MNNNMIISSALIHYLEDLHRGRKMCDWQMTISIFNYINSLILSDKLYAEYRYCESLQGKFDIKVRATAESPRLSDVFIINGERYTVRDLFFIQERVWKENSIYNSIYRAEWKNDELFQQISYYTKYHLLSYYGLYYSIPDVDLMPGSISFFNLFGRRDFKDPIIIEGFPFLFEAVLKESDSLFDMIDKAYEISRMKEMVVIKKLVGNVFDTLKSGKYEHVMDLVCQIEMKAIQLTILLGVTSSSLNLGLATIKAEKRRENYTPYSSVTIDNRASKTEVLLASHMLRIFGYDMNEDDAIKITRMLSATI